MDNYYRNKQISADIKKELYKHPILSYNRYKYEDQRGHNLFSNEQQENRNLADIRIKHKDNHWEQLAKNVEGKFFSLNFSVKIFFLILINFSLLINQYKIFKKKISITLRKTYINHHSKKIQ